MEIPKEFKTKNNRTKKIHNYEFVKEYPNYYQYRCLENGVLECFQRSFFVKEHVRLRRRGRKVKTW